MTADELKSNIQFREVNDGPHRIRLIGGITLSADILISHIALHENRERVMDNCRERLREAIARRLYDDQRKELYEAVDAFVASHYPIPFIERNGSRERLLKAARYQEGKAGAEADSH